MTSDRRYLSQDISCSKQYWFLQRRDKHFYPETFKVATQILSGTKGTYYHKNHFEFCPHVPY